MKTYDLTDLVPPEVKKLLDSREISLSTNSDKLLQQNLSTRAKLAIERFHLLNCADDDCAWYEEEAIEGDEWVKPEHVRCTQNFVKLMNNCQMDLSQWENLLPKYMRTIELIGGPGPLHDLIKHLYYKHK